MASTIENEKNRSYTRVKNGRPGFTTTPQILFSTSFSLVTGAIDANAWAAPRRAPLRKLSFWDGAQRSSLSRTTVTSPDCR